MRERNQPRWCGNRDEGREKKKERKKIEKRKTTIFSILWEAWTMKYMAGSHFSLMYSDANENERLWVKVEQSLQTCSIAASNSPQLRGETFLLQRHSKVCPQNSEHYWGNILLHLLFLRILGFICFCLLMFYLFKSLEDMCASLCVCTQEACSSCFQDLCPISPPERIPPTHLTVAR